MTGGKSGKSFAATLSEIGSGIGKRQYWPYLGGSEIGSRGLLQRAANWGVHG